MTMRKGKTLNKVFDRLRVALDVVEGLEGLGFARTKEWGYVTSCPTNLGTGMRASVLVKLPKLGATGVGGIEAVAGPLGLAVRGLGGEHTAIGEDGMVDISPSARFCVSEAQIMGTLYNGLKMIVSAYATATTTRFPSTFLKGLLVFDGFCPKHVGFSHRWKRNTGWRNTGEGRRRRLRKAER